MELSPGKPTTMAVQRLPAAHGGRAVQNLMVCRGKHRLTVKNCKNLVQKSFKIRWQARGMHLLGSYSGGFLTTLVLTAVGGAPPPRHQPSGSSGLKSGLEQPISVNSNSNSNPSDQTPAAQHLDSPNPCHSQPIRREVSFHRLGSSHSSNHRLAVRRALLISF